MTPAVRELTAGPGGRILTNAHVWSADGQWIAFDTRSDPAGDTFDGTRIQAVHVASGEVRTLYESRNGACCGVATWHPTRPAVCFILGPEHPSADWSYGPSRRQGVMVELDRPGMANPLDARDLTPPFTPGALRGGSHVHIWHPRGDRFSFTYDDQILPPVVNQRNVGVGLAGMPVAVPRTHPRNHDGSCFCVLVTRTTNAPRPGSDDIVRAYEEAWLGPSGRSLAFQGQVLLKSGRLSTEVFVVDLPDDLTVPGDGPLQGTPDTRPMPPKGTSQRRLTRGGIDGPRHWLRSSPDGGRIGFLRTDAAGVVQFWTVTPAGETQQVTANPHPVASAFTWHPVGRHVAFVMDRSVCITDVTTGVTTRLTEPTDPPPRPEACVFSPDGACLSFVRQRPAGSNCYNQMCVVPVM